MTGKARVLLNYVLQTISRFNVVLGAINIGIRTCPVHRATRRRSGSAARPHGDGGGGARGRAAAGHRGRPLLRKLAALVRRHDRDGGAVGGVVPVVVEAVGGRYRRESDGAGQRDCVGLSGKLCELKLLMVHGYVQGYPSGQEQPPVDFNLECSSWAVGS